MSERPIDRLLGWAKQRNWNQSALAREMGVSPQDVTNWKARGLPPDMFLRAADVIGRSVDELLGRPIRYAQLQPTPSVGVVREISLHSLTVVPVMSWEGLMSEELPQVFKVAIPDESLEPEARRGMHVELTRGLEPKPGDGVLVRDRDGRHYLRIYRQRRPGEWSAHAIHADYEPLDAAIYGLSVVAVVTATEGRWS